MEKLNPEKNSDYMCDINYIYKKRFYNLELDRLSNVYINSLKYLKGYPSIMLLQYNSNICVYDSHSRQYCLIRKEHFVDELSDSEKEMHYRRIKRFTDAVIYAERILKKWYAELEKIGKEDCEAMGKKSKPANYGWYINAKRLFNQVVAYAPKSLLPKQPPIFNKKFSGTLPPEEVAKFLYQVCDGDIETLRTLAKFSYKIVYEPWDCLATVILADEKIHGVLKEFFNFLFATYMSNFPFELNWMDFNTLKLKENRLCFLENEFNRNLPILLTKGDTIYKKGDGYSFFKKLFGGKEISIENPYFDDELIFKNSIPIICVVGDEKRYNTMQNLYKKIRFIKIETSELEFSENLFGGYEWLREEFLLIGKKEVEVNAEMAVPYELDHEKEVQKFMRTCCTLGEGKKCTEEEFYNAYKEYFDHSYPDEVSLSKRKLCEKVKELKSHRIVAKRIHIKKDENPTFLLGVALKSNWSELYKNEPIHEHFKTKKEKFEVILNNLSKECFEIVQPNVRKVKATIDERIG